MDISIDTSRTSPTFGDLRLVMGDLVLTSDSNPAGSQYVLQNILQRLRMFAGEWFLNKSLGVRYYQVVFVKSPNRALIDAEFKRVILQTPGVTALTQWSIGFLPATRNITVSFRCGTAAGDITYDGPLNTATAMVVT